MPRNSLKEESIGNLNSKIAELKLSITHPNNENKVFVLLEGKTDIKLFRKIFDKQNADTTALEGKDKVVSALLELKNCGYKSVIGIKDADFDHLGELEKIDNLFLTDYHDMEVQMIESRAMDSIVSEYSSDNCHGVLLDTIKEHIYKVAINIGYMRWHNEKEKEHKGSHILLFDGLSFDKFITVATCSIEINVDDFLNTIISHSEAITQSSELTKEKLGASQALLAERSSDKLQICSGHDLAKLIALIFSKKINTDKNNINQEKVEEALRLAYNIDDFKNTKLHTDLVQWCDNAGLKLFAYTPCKDV